MHPTDIPPDVVARVAPRRGEGPLFRDVDPRRAALLVIDLQNAFVVDGCGPTHVAAAMAIVPNVNRLAAAVRATGGTVWWIQHTVTDAGTASWSNHARFLGLLEQGEQARATVLREGSAGHRLFAGLDVGPDDEHVLKTRFSPFVPGASNIHERLRRAGVDTLLVAGTATNVCCESTVRDAMALDYRCVLVSDANAARSDAEHVAALVNVYTAFGDVLSTERVLDLLGAARSVSQRGEPSAR